MILRSQCPLCGADVDETNQFTTTGAGYVLLKCRACGMIYGREAFTPDDYRAVYDQSNADGYSGPAIVAQNRAYADQFFGARERGRVLEVGCGTGAFLGRMAELGYDCVGVEPSPAMADRARARGLLVAGMPFEAVYNAEAVNGPFDVVVTFHVLEHAADPVAFAARVARFLRPGGTWFNYMPFITAWIPKVHGPGWIHFSPGRPQEHCNFFDELTLKRLAEGAGFRVDLFGAHSDDFWMWAVRRGC